MMKTRLFLTIAGFVTLGLIAACAPKSRYRAIDLAKPVVTSDSTKKPVVTSEVTPTPETLNRNVPDTPTPEDEDSQTTVRGTEFIGLKKQQEEGETEKHKVDLYITTKVGTSVETRVLNLEASKTSISLEQVNRLRAGDVMEEVSDSATKVEGTCTDNKCDSMRITLSKGTSKVSINAGVESKIMRISSADARLTIEKKEIKDLIDTDIVIQRSLVRMSGKEYLTLTIGTEEGIVFGMVPNKAIQKISAIYGKKNGIDTADFSGDEKNFDLTLRDKEGDILAKLKIGPVPSPAPAPEVAACEMKDDTLVLTLACFKQNDDKDSRVKDTYLVTVDVKEDHPGRELKYLLEGSSEQVLSFTDGEVSKDVSSLKAATALKFMIKTPDVKSKASILLNDTCCKVSKKVTAPASH